MRKQVILTLLCIALSVCGSQFGPGPVADRVPFGAKANPAVADVTAAA
ncbi:hypothetical protein ABU162_27720 [Paenibacillus thiaminolyticus]